MFALGARRSTDAKVRHRVSAQLHPLIATKLRGGISSAADLTQYCAPIFDQGASGSCTAHSVSGVAVTAFASMASRGLAMPLPFVPSPRQIYAATRALERTVALPPGGGPLPLLTDSGAELADVAQVLREYGVAPMSGSTPDGRNSDIWTALDTSLKPANVNDEPNVDELEAAASKVIDGEYSVSTGTADSPETIAASIDAGIPVWAAGFVDSIFQNLRASDVAPAPNMNDPHGGGHAFFFARYRTNSVGKLEFELRNSWGPGYANGGSVWVSTAFILALWEAWPFASGFRKAAA